MTGTRGEWDEKASATKKNGQPSPSSRFPDRDLSTNSIGRIPLPAFCQRFRLARWGIGTYPRAKPPYLPGILANTFSRQLLSTTTSTSS